jgi:hypothetical protein
MNPIHDIKPVVRENYFEGIPQGYDDPRRRPESGDSVRLLPNHARIGECLRRNQVYAGTQLARQLRRELRPCILEGEVIEVVPVKKPLWVQGLGLSQVVHSGEVREYTGLKPRGRRLSDAHMDEKFRSHRD